MKTYTIEVDFEFDVDAFDEWHVRKLCEDFIVWLDGEIFAHQITCDLDTPTGRMLNSISVPEILVTSISEVRDGE